MSGELPRWPFLAAFGVPVLHLVGLELGGAALWLLPLEVFLLVPLADHLAPPWRAEAAPNAPRSRGHDLLLELWVPVQLAVLAYTLRAVTLETPTAAEWLPLALSTGLVTGGIGITVAHELLHRRERLHRAFAEVLLSTVLYAHFAVEHVLGHHRNVGLREDPATARPGESFYRFLPRSVLGGLVSAWRLEARRAARRAWYEDRRWRHAGCQTALVAAVAWLLGPVALALFLAQAAVAVVLLELVNYVEHYGLERGRGEDGRSERVRPEHSWNSNAAVSSAHLFLLTRHSHHHAEASRPYDRLAPLADAPMLPAGYPTMMLASLVPPLWYRWMDGALSARSRL